MQKIYYSDTGLLTSDSPQWCNDQLLTVVSNDEQFQYIIAYSAVNTPGQRWVALSVK